MNLQEFADKIGNGECNRLYCLYTPHEATRRQQVKTCGDIAMYVRSMQQRNLGYFCLEWEYPYGQYVSARCLASNVAVDARTLTIRSMQVVVMNGDAMVCSVRNVSPMVFTGATLRQVNQVLQPFLRAEAK